jgi:transposase
MRPYRHRDVELRGAL